MKKVFPKVIAISTIFVFGVGAFAFKNKSPIELSATQHETNYSEYVYSGSYYDGLADNLTNGINGTLKSALATLALPKGWYTYSGSQSGQLGKELQSADQDPTNSSNMVMFYSRDSVTKRSSGNGSGNWNREHVWPRSLSNNNWSSSNGGSVHAGADILHVRPTWYDTNETRGSIMYGDANKTTPLTYNNMTYAYSGNGYFEPLDSVKGDVARILMYVYTVYSVYYNDSNLYVTRAIESYDVLLKWHTMDKPDALEGVRNNFSETSKQKNRNPFVDHPEYAWKIFGEKASESVREDCRAIYPDPNQVTPPPSSSSQQTSSKASSTAQSSSSAEVSSSSAISSSEKYSSMESSSSEEESSSRMESTMAPSSTEIIGSSSSTISSGPEPVSYDSSNESQAAQESSGPDVFGSSNGENNNNNKKRAGCGGSLVVIPFAGFSAFIGLIFVLSKKKK